MFFGVLGFVGGFSGFFGIVFLFGFCWFFFLRDMWVVYFAQKHTLFGVFVLI